jgi:hypothetical protein
MELEELCTWFTELEHDKQLLCIDFMKDKKENTINDLSEEEFSKLYKLWVEIKNLIDDKNNNKEVIFEILLSNGLEKISAESFYDYCIKNSFPESDARIIELIDNKKFKKVVSFVVESTLLYSNFKYMKFEEFMKLGELNNEEYAKRILRFIRNNTLEVVSREISKEQLEKEMLNEYKISKEKVNIIIDNIEDNWDKLQNSFLIKSLNDITRRLNRLEDVLETKKDL